MTHALGLAPIDAVRIPPMPTERTYSAITEADLRAAFTDSFGPLVAPIPRSPRTWPPYLAAVEYIRIRDVLREKRGAGMVAEIGNHLAMLEREISDEPTTKAPDFDAWARAERVG